jgi:hypothetical protein
MDALIGKFLADTGAVVPVPNPAYGKNVGSPAPRGKAALTAGWSPDHDCRLAVRDGTLVITSTGSDPYLSASLPILPAGEYTLSMRLKSAAAGSGQVFWQEQGVTPRFLLARSAGFTPTADGQWKGYSVRFRTTRPLTGLRLDPAQGSGEIALSSLSLTDRTGRTVAEWPFTRTAGTGKGKN